MDVKGIVVKVFDRFMKPTKVEYKIKNTPLQEFVPTWAHPIIVRRLSSGAKAPKAGEVAGEYKMGRLTYLAFYIGDTHAKDGRIIYIEKRDAEKLLAAFPDFFLLARDSVYLGRALIPYGNTYGGMRKKNMRILVLKRGSTYMGMRIEDGSIIYDPKVIPNRGKSIELGVTSNNFSIFQHLDWDKIASDVVKLAGELKDTVKNVDHNLLVHGKSVTWEDKRGVKHEVPGLGFDDKVKQRFLALSPQLAKHPWFSRGASDGSARWIASHAFAPYLSMKCYLAVAFHAWTLPIGKWIAYRHPVIAGSSTHALQIKKAVKLPAEIKGGAVSTITGRWKGGKQFTIKGAGVIMPLPDGIDIVCCEDNIKIGKRLGDNTLEADAYITIIQRYQRSALMGVPYKEFQKMNGDYDGDLINFINANSIPAIYDNVKLHENDSVNFKLPRKNSDPWSRENVEKVLLNAMASNMGWATVLHSWYLAKAPAEREELVSRLFPLCEELASAMNPTSKTVFEPTMLNCLAILQSFIQFQIEAIKNVDCDTSVTNTVAAKIQSLLSTWTGDRQPSYLGVRRAREKGVAFVSSFPQFLSEMDPDWVSKMRSNSKYRRQWEWKIHMADGLDGGVPTECFKLNRASLNMLWDEVVENPDPYAPFTYAAWVEPISQSQEAIGVEMCTLFQEYVANFEVARTTGDFNVFDPTDVAMFREQWRDMMLEFADTRLNGDYDLAARILWRVSHTIGDHILTGATFLAFPDETEGIIIKWSGTIQSHHCIAAGYKKMSIFAKGLPSKLEGKCELITIEGRTCIRPLEPIKGHDERLFGYIADIEKNESQQGLSIPPDGFYSYKFTIRSSGSAYFATFDPLSEEQPS